MAKQGEAEVHPVAAEFIDFLNASPTAFHAVGEAKRQLKQAGYEQISEREDWTLEPGGKYFFTRNHSTIVAFAIGHKWSRGEIPVYYATFEARKMDMNIAENW